MNIYVPESIGLVALVVYSVLPLFTIYVVWELLKWEFTQILSIDMIQFEDVRSQSDSEEDLRKLVDPRLGDSCPFDSVRKVISHSQ